MFAALNRLIHWLDSNSKDKRAVLVNQLFPIVVCVAMFFLFMGGTHFFITHLINPRSVEKIVIHILPLDFFIGFFLYFVTAVDYALIVGRMQIVNTGIKSRFIMNVFTCLGCFVGVSLVLFVWGFAKEVDWIIIALLIFAGCVMAKLAYEGLEYFQHSNQIWKPLRDLTSGFVTYLHHLTEGLTFWIPELGSPSVKRMSWQHLASWSFFLPFVIGIDDFVGYMGAMTIYNVFSLLTGIFLADIVIDIMIFVSPSFTKKMVESALLSLLATYAFLYLTYKSFSEAAIIIGHTEQDWLQKVYLIAVVCLSAFLLGHFVHKRRKLKVI